MMENCWRKSRNGTSCVFPRVTTRTPSITASDRRVSISIYWILVLCRVIIGNLRSELGMDKDEKLESSRSSGNLPYGECPKTPDHNIGYNSLGRYLASSSVNSCSKPLLSVAYWRYGLNWLWRGAMVDEKIWVIKHSTSYSRKAQASLDGAEKATFWAPDLGARNLGEGQNRTKSGSILDPTISEIEEPRS
ncbi:uncharacterized protein CIMG_12765 [Coccidioides immitis RS]|uniref:Uncharacterized protein n=1 Tax=Coccidioides immitis (strain RS) TaxID=246410 RepID=A0A0D8JSN8_COCIM|nr:uncharacterized protein CIMG_12765 [Coccidioides immitis RS]KJF60129.1 hypothetical protein CIMG_12765 [Coccidioides immitis RS]